MSLSAMGEFKKFFWWTLPILYFPLICLPSLSIEKKSIIQQKKKNSYGNKFSMKSYSYAIGLGI